VESNPVGIDQAGLGSRPEEKKKREGEGGNIRGDSKNWRKAHSEQSRIRSMEEEGEERKIRKKDLWGGESSKSERRRMRGWGDEKRERNRGEKLKEKLRLEGKPNANLPKRSNGKGRPVR